MELKEENILIIPNYYRNNRLLQGLQNCILLYFMISTFHYICVHIDRKLKLQLNL